MADNAGSKKRLSFTNEKKLSCIKRIRSGTKPSEICRELNLARSTVSTWMKQEKTIQEAVDKGNVLVNKNRSTKNDKLDEALLKWFKQVRLLNTAVDGPLLLTKANEMANMLGSSPVSKPWIDRWKKRHKIGAARVVGESASVNLNTVSEWRSQVLPGFLERYKPEDIFNMDETGLFYRMEPDKTLHFKGQTCSGGKQSKERITIAVTANMSGTEKLELLVIGKFGKPRCFKNVRCLPVDYHHNKKA